METRRILLAGEASGVHAALKEGLVGLGHEVVHATLNPPPQGRDPPDIVTGSQARGNGPWSIARRYARPVAKVGRLGRFDATNFVMDVSLFPGGRLYLRDLPLLRRRTGVLTYYAIGCHSLSLIRLREDLPYRPCEGCQRYDALGALCNQSMLPMHPRVVERAAGLFDAVAVSMPDFDAARTSLGDAKYFRIALPVPIPAPSAFDPDLERVRILHAPTRVGFKGTAIILEVLQRLQAMREDIVVRTVSGVSHAELLATLGSQDLLVDQIHTQGCGVQALEAMAMHKAVVSGNTPLAQAFFPFGAENPTIPTSPDPVKLLRILDDAVEDREGLADRRLRGRAYVVGHHAPDVVAKEFLRMWDAAGKGPAVPGVMV